MLKTFIKEVLLGKTDLLFSQNLIGRTLREKGLKLASRELGIPLDMQPDSATPGYWLISIGASDAHLCTGIRVCQKTLIEFIVFGANAWLENRKLRPADYMPMLIREMNSPAQKP